MKINEVISKGISYRRCIDVASNLWEKISFWTSASDVEFADGQTAEQKIGKFKGVVASTGMTEPGYAADATIVGEINRNLDNLSSNVNRINFYRDSDEQWHFVNGAGADSVIPFSGGAVKRYKIASTNSLSQHIYGITSTVPNYKSLTADNFAIYITSVAKSEAANDVREGGAVLRYEPEYGVVTVEAFADHEIQTLQNGYQAAYANYDLFVYY